MSASSPQSAPKKPLLSNGTYNVLKHVASAGLPAAAALYFGASQIWHLPHADQTMATIAIVNTFLGALLGYSTASYNNSETKYAGVLQVVETEARQLFSLELNHDPADLANMQTATFKVAPPVAPQPLTGFAEPENPPTIGS